MPKSNGKLNNYRGDTSDFSIIDRALAGEQLAFEELFQKHKVRIFRFFMRFTKGDFAASEDFVQDTFVSAFSKLHTFNKNAAFYTWLCKIAVNVFRMSYRRKKYCFVPIDELWGRQVTSGGLIVEGISDDDKSWSEKRGEIGRLDRTMENVPSQITVEKLMRGLPPGYKKALTLHDLQGFEYQEAAAMLGCSPGNVKSQRHRAKMKLRAAVQTAHVPISTNPTLNN